MLFRRSTVSRPPWQVMGGSGIVIRSIIMACSRTVSFPVVFVFFLASIPCYPVRALFPCGRECEGVHDPYRRRLRFFSLSAYKHVEKLYTHSNKQYKPFRGSAIISTITLAVVSRQIVRKQ